MAERFRFRLEVVERVRRTTLDRERRALAESLRRAQEVERRLDELNGELRATFERARGSQAMASLDVATLKAEHVLRASLHDRIRRSAAELDEKEAECRTARERVALATRNLRVMEKLRERRWNEHLVDVRRSEQAAEDEAAAGMFLRVPGDRSGKR